MLAALARNARVAGGRWSLVQSSAGASAPAVSSLRNAPRGYAAAAADIEDQDVVIIGGGPGGYVAAIKAAQVRARLGAVQS